jgi:hypothetical protein
MRNIILIITLLIMFVANYPILKLLYPLCDSDYNEFLKFYEARNGVYEVMFLLFFLLSYSQSRGLVKSISSFAVVLSAGSVIDKCIFSLNRYLITDSLLVIVALITSYIVYIKDHSNVREN